VICGVKIVSQPLNNFHYTLLENLKILQEN